MKASASITRRLTFAVLLIEFVAALILITTVGNHERHVQFSVFKANLQANANVLSERYKRRRRRTEASRWTAAAYSSHQKPSIVLPIQAEPHSRRKGKLQSLQSP